MFDIPCNNVIKCTKTIEEEQVASLDASQRAAGGGIAVRRTWGEWASEGELKCEVGEPENILRYQRKHMSSMHEWMRITASSRVAPQELI